MTSKAHKVRVAVFAIISGVLFAFTVIVFAGVHFWRDRTSYHIVFSRSVYGLERGADVYCNGVLVGSVDDIRIDSEDISRVRVDIEVDSSTPVRADTHAVLAFGGITGVKVVDLRGGTAHAARLPAHARIAEGTSVLDDLEDRGTQLVTEAQKLIEHANTIADRVDVVVGNLNDVTSQAQLGELVEQTTTTARNFAAATDSLRRLIDTNRVGLRGTLAAIELAANRAAELADNGQLRAAVADLRQATRNFKELAREVRQKPSRLLFSSPEPDRKLP